MPRVSLVFAFCLYSMPGNAESPLAPGKPAGIHAAQAAPSGVIFIGAIVLLAFGGLALSSQPYKIPGQSSATSTNP